MRFNKLDLNLLVALDALLTERSITRAAERVHLSQSAMSNALARLREQLGDELLVQVGRQMELTPRAEVLQEAVRDVLVRIDTSIAAQPGFDCTRTEREFTLLVSDYTMTVLMPHVLALATRQRSRARLRLAPQTDSPARALERAEADLLVIPQAFCSPEHPTQRLFTEGYCCVVWSGSRHARTGLDAARYAAADHAVTHPVNAQQAAFEQAFMQRYGMARRVAVSTYSFSALPFLVVGTELVATVHATLARRMAAAAPLTLLSVPLDMPPLEQAMQWHKYRTQDPGLIWLRQLLQDAALAMREDTPLQPLAAA